MATSSWPQVGSPFVGTTQTMAVWHVSRQLTGEVLWEQTIRQMVFDGVAWLRNPQGVLPHPIQKGGGRFLDNGTNVQHEETCKEVRRGCIFIYLHCRRITDHLCHFYLWLDNHHRSPSHPSSPRWRTSTKSARWSSWSRWLRGEAEDFLWLLVPQNGALAYPFIYRTAGHQVEFYHKNNAIIQEAMHYDAHALLKCSLF